MSEKIDVNKISQEFENRTAEELLTWADKEFGDKIALACSFGAEDVVLVDMVLKVNPKARIFTLDTGRLHQETYDVMERLRQKYKINFEVCFPDKKETEEMLSKYGPNLFYNSIELRKLCCNVRKVNPLKKVLANLDAWITGLRRQQAVTRTDIGKVEFDKAFNIIKINPIADWSQEEVWDYIKKNSVPYNLLHDKGYPSIGCAPCSRPVKPGEDIRAGRWWWENPESKECGLHKHNK